jgi:O-acetyl-ADP-ribose deacetylase (regulator of RNase III)
VHHREFLGGRLVITVGDLVAQQVDAIVNAANSSLLGGGGVDGAIHRAGGPRILEECREIRRTEHPRGLETGGAVITSGGDLPARYVIHTVGPIYGQHGGGEAGLLARSYRNSLELAARHGVTSIAFPAISTGAFGYPAREAGRIAAQTVADFLRSDARLTEIRLVFFSPDQADLLLNDHEFLSNLNEDGDEPGGSNR